MGCICVRPNGRMAEWSNAAVLKTAEPETVPGVRIPLLPPFFIAYFILLPADEYSDHNVQCRPCIYSYSSG
jgi:hypothetical protein